MAAAATALVRIAHKVRDDLAHGIGFNPGFSRMKGWRFHGRLSERRYGFKHPANGRAIHE